MIRAFGATSTTDEVLEGWDLSGKTVLVTGASSGLGVETVRALAAHDARVIGAVRDVNKAREATAWSGRVQFIELDLASLASVRRCADELNGSDESFDLVIANAGVMACPFRRTVDGFETQLGTNYLGHFVLVNRIAPRMSSGARLVSLSSAAHSAGVRDLEDLNFVHRPYDPVLAYARSKAANVLFSVEFDRRHKARGVRATAVHPGGIRTSLDRHVSPEFVDGLIEARKPGASKSFVWKSVQQGAATTVWAGVVAPADEVGGHYCEDCHVAAPSQQGGVDPWALDPERAKALWAESEALVGERF